MIRTFAAAALLAAALFSSFLIAPAAQAQTAPESSVVATPHAVAAAAQDSRCPANSFCLFQNINYGGDRLSFSQPPSGYGFRQCDLGVYGFDNKASSMINNTNRSVVLYRNAGCGGNAYLAVPKSVDPDFRDNKVSDGNFNDKATGIVIQN